MFCILFLKTEMQKVKMSPLILLPVPRTHPKSIGLSKDLNSVQLTKAQSPMRLKSPSAKRQTKATKKKTNGDLILEHIEAKSTEETDKNPSLSRTEKDSLSESSSKAINDKDAKDKKQSVKELLDGYKDEIKADRAKDIADKSKTVADTVIKSAKSIKER